MSRMVISLLLATLFATSGRAAPFRVADLPEQAKWFIHINVDGVRETKRLQPALQRLLATPEIKRVLTELPALKKFQWHDLTAYECPSSEIVVVLGIDATERAITPLLQAETGYVRVSSGKATIHHWVSDPENKKATTTILAGKSKIDEQEMLFLSIPQPGRLVLATRLSDLVRQLNVWRGTAQAVSAENCPHHKQLKGQPTLVQYRRLSAAGQGEATAGAAKTLASEGSGRCCRMLFADRFFNDGFLPGGFRSPRLKRL